MRRNPPKVWSIPQERNFIPALAEFIHALSREKDLSSWAIFLPNLRTSQSLLRCLGPKTLLLPKIYSLGSVEELLAFHSFDLLPPPAEREERLFFFMQNLCLTNPIPRPEALRLAHQLEGLHDYLLYEEIPYRKEIWSSLGNDMEDIGKLLYESWPKACVHMGKTDPTNYGIAGLRWLGKKISPQTIVAGSMGTRECTRDFLRGVLDNGGYWIMPGLDPMRQPSEENLRHPQYALHACLRALQISPEDVRNIPSQPSAQHENRKAYVRSAFKTSSECVPPPRGKIENVFYHPCPSTVEEAERIALIAKRALAQQKSVLIISPSYLLLDFTAYKLHTMGIRVSPTAESILANQEVATLISCFLKLAQKPADSTAHLEWTTHPLSKLSEEERGELLEWVEKTVYLGSDVILSSQQPTQRARLLGELAPLRQTHLTLPTLGKQILLLLERYADPDIRGRPDYKVVAGFVRALCKMTGIGIPPLDCLPLFQTWCEQTQVKDATCFTHPNVVLTGLLDARLQRADVVILGELTEATWPAEIAVNPWVSRKTQRELGLRFPEIQLGLAAHDFIEWFYADEVHLTHALTQDAKKTSPSPFLRRLEMALVEAGFQGLDVLRDRSMETSQHLWRAYPHAAPTYIQSKRVTPPKELLPNILYVTQLNDLLENPYEFFLRHLLRLQPSPLVKSIQDRLRVHRGILIHHILGSTWNWKAPTEEIHAYFRDFVEKLLPQKLVRISPYLTYLKRRTLLELPETFAHEIERLRTYNTCASFKEINLKKSFGRMTLAARADRVDENDDGAWILDYKTGRPAPKKQKYHRQLNMEAELLPHKKVRRSLIYIGREYTLEDVPHDPTLLPSILCLLEEVNSNWFRYAPKDV